MDDCIYVVGIDCATEPQKTGLTFGYYLDRVMYSEITSIGIKDKSIADIVYSWIKDKTRVLIAIDAPLGWPKGLGDNLSGHYAGEALNIDSNLLFRRETDRFIKRKIGKQPLDVGADRIARTAHSAVKILDDLKIVSSKPVKLAWDLSDLYGISVIEVYPAATLNRYNIISTGYKDKDKESIRNEIIKSLGDHIIIKNKTDILRQDANALDSAVCLLSAKNFIEKNVYYPEDLILAQKEGWIWVKNAVDSKVDI